MSEATDAERLKLAQEVRRRGASLMVSNMRIMLCTIADALESAIAEKQALEKRVAGEIRLSDGAIEALKELSAENDKLRTEKRAAEKERDIEKNIATGYHAKWVIADDAYAALFEQNRVPPRPRDRGNHD